MTGLNIETNMTFFGPSGYIRPCPNISSHVTRFKEDESTTTRFNQTCILYIPKVKVEQSGHFYCEVDPVRNETCHNLTDSINVQIYPPNSFGISVELGIEVGIPIVLILTLALVTCFITPCGYKKYKKYKQSKTPSGPPTETTPLKTTGT